MLMKLSLKTPLIIALVTAAVFGAAAQASTDRSAAAILERCTSAIDKAGAVQMDFTIQGQGGDFAGKITMASNYFTMVVPGVRIWFDGRTQWTLLEEQSSVSITEPTPEELMESNPFVILANYSKRYNARRIAGAPAGAKSVVLTPTGKSAAGIAQAVLTVSDATWLPSEVDITFDNGAEIKATVTACRTVARPNQAAFRFPQKDYQAIEIVDLR